MSKNRFRNRMGDTAMLLTGFAIGAGAMYVFDPEAGAGRRAAVGQKVVGGSRTAGRWLGSKTLDTANRAWGAVAELGSRLGDRGREIPDDQLEARVRAQLGHVVSHPGALTVHAQSGAITISGDVLEGERTKIEERLGKTRGVRSCTIEVHEHGDANGIPSLQGHSRWQRQTGT